MIYKTCNECETTKDINCFHKRSDSPDGHRNQCKQCKKVADHEYWNINGEMIKHRNLTYKKENSELVLSKARDYKANNREKVMLGMVKKRASAYCLSFDLDINDIVIPKYCPLLDIKLNFNGSMNNRDTSPSIDRINSKKGYVKGNIRIISYRANRIKNDATPDELKMIAERIDEYCHE